MKQKQVVFWLLDALILTAFLVEYKIAWTGLRFHELAGLFIFGLLLVHLLTHWQWVDAVTRKFFQILFKKACFCLILDIGLLALFLTITLSGLVISSLLNLSLKEYELWRWVHVSVSYLTLALVGLKIAMHWK